MNTLAQETGELLKKHKLSLGVIESATGGLISHLITNIAGSSDFYQGSITSYNNEIKMRLVGVRKETLDKYGAVSARVAEEMAEGGRKALGTDICIADTGIAGPAGATKNKPVGLFYLGLSHRDGSYNRKYVFHGTREQNKAQAAEAALTWLKEYLTELDQTGPKHNTIVVKPVVTCFLVSANKILLLRRSSKVGTYQGLWAGVSGYIENTADKQALIEIREETGLEAKDLELIKKGKPIEVIDSKLKVKWIVHPFSYRINNPDKVNIDWEHQEFKWIAPEEIGHYQTVPKLEEALDSVI